MEDGISYVIFSMAWNPSTIDIGFFDNSVIDAYEMPDTNIYNSVMDKQDIIYIRTLFQQGCSRQEAYEPFKEKISINGFSRI